MAAAVPDFLAGGGEMGALLRAHDWQGHPLGLPATWPQALRTAIRLLLTTRHPGYIFWGEAGYCFYNDAYRPSIGVERHPGSLGRPARDVWDEIWTVIGPQIDQVMTGGGATWHENQLIPITRDGSRDEVYWTYSYSPIDDERAPGGIGGVLVICNETTERVMAGQRLNMERERQRLMLQQMPGFAALLSGPDHRFDYVNDAYRSLSGERTFIGRTVREVFPDIAEQGFYERLDQVYATGEPFAARALPVQLDRADGDRVVDLLYEPIRDDAGRVTGIFVGGYDITDGTRAGQRRDALVALDERLRDLTDPAELSFAASEMLGLALGAARVGYGAVDHQAGTITVRRNWSAPGFSSLAGLHRLGDYGDYVDDLRQGRAVAIADVALDPRTRARIDAFRAIGVAAFLDVPVVENNQTVGQLFVHSATPRRWTEDDAALVRDVAKRTRAAIARRSAEEERLASEAELRFTLEAGRFGAWTYDVATGELTTTATCRANYGRDPALAFSYPDLLDAVHPDDKVRMRTAVEHSMTTGQDYDIEYRIVTPAGDTRWVQIRGQPTYAADGAPVAMAGVSIDVTDARRTEAALGESEHRYRTLFDTIDEGFCVIEFIDGPDGPLSDYVHVEANTAYERHAGIPEVVGQRVREMVPDEAAEWVERYRRVLDTGEPARFEQELVATGRHLELAAFRVEPAGRRQVAVLFQDITARRRAETELRDTSERLRLATDHAEIGSWDVDLIADTLIWPARTKAMFGISPGVPVTLQDFYDGLHPDDFEATSAAFDAATDPARRALYDAEYRTVGREDGVVRWVAAKGRGLFDEAGRCIRVLGTAIDITARKRDEERLRELNDDLEARVAERTAELASAQDQLRQAQKMEAMGQLTGGVAHDFNNLLTPIVGALDLLARKGLGGEREQRLIAGAAQSAERARLLVQRLLAFARRQPLSPLAVDVAALAGGMAELIASTTGPQIKVTVEAPSGLPPAQADPNQLEMALLNLAVNARDAMPDGGTLRISATAETADAAADLAAGGYIRLSVADTGGGMDEATLARAIEPFFSTKGIGKGTGLGLSMAHGLASQLGGALRIRSKPGVGTNVELWLPRARTQPAAEPAAQKAPSTAQRGVALLVDDEDLVRYSTADMLAELGYRVVEAASGEEALAILDKGARIDVVVTDHLMPGMTGSDLARAARERRRELPVLVVSGYAEVEDIAPDLPRLAKPFRKDDLAASLAGL